ncbi:unnamed protein product [Rangifer tarandus platyrhynchus]|uniref:Uncharacterized protein n=1 Tax=Rangifer tarandus platyrhynchus TaxID=3082113 RepID=A0ABN8XVC3_RANTA|nr:unnamed protein product [Rangifer tarandus platyrhynchus]
MPTKDRGNQKVKCSGTTKRNALLPSVPPAATPDKLHIVPAGKLAMLQAYSRAVELGFGELWKRIHVVFSRQRGRLLPPGAPASPSVRESGLEQAESPAVFLELVLLSLKSEVELRAVSFLALTLQQPYEGLLGSVRLSQARGEGRLLATLGSGST